MANSAAESVKKKGIGIGREDFKEIIERNAYFVDKTMMIKEVIDSVSSVTLITRPRRFGKTLNLSMLRRFFEDERKADGTVEGAKIDNRHLFEGLKISKCGEEVLKHQQQYPVINLSLKSAKQPDFEMAYASLVDEIVKEFNRHIYVLSSDALSEKEKQEYKLICNKEAEVIAYAKALAFLSECLSKYHEVKTIILIDEYDVPLENAYFAGFYDEMIAFIRSLFESALKTNPYLEKGIITGCLRISKESIFTGLNNLEVDTVLHTAYGGYFGFTQNEVEEMLAYYGLEKNLDEVKEWYDGYRFGSVEIYNPWSISKYVSDHDRNVSKFPLPYWSNTSSNSIVKEMIENADEEARADLEVLLNGGTIEKQVHEDVTYGDIHENMDNLWNFLFFTGYLKYEGERLEEERLFVSMSVPNLEVKSVYTNSIKNWFDKKIKGTNRSPLIEALESGDCEGAAEFISDQLMDTISYYDYSENYYHGFLAGQLNGTGRYLVTSNRESGTGRADMILREKKFCGKAMILEVNVTKDIRKMYDRCDEALAQIEREHYEEPLIADGYTPILKYGICFFKKGCRMKSAK